MTKARTRTKQNTAKQCRYDTERVKARKNTRQGKSVYNLEMHDLQFGIVIPLSYLCIVVENTN